MSTLPTISLLESGCCIYRDMTEDNIDKAKQETKKKGYHLYISEKPMSWTLNTPLYSVILTKDPLPIIPDNYSEAVCN